MIMTYGLRIFLGLWFIVCFCVYPDFRLALYGLGAMLGGLFFIIWGLGWLAVRVIHGKREDE